MTGKNCDPGMNIYSMKYSMDLENEAQKYASSCPTSGSSADSRTTGENFALIPSSSAATYYDAVFQAIQKFWRVIRLSPNGVNQEMVFVDALENSTFTRFTQVSSLIKE
ncbi:hypothetical protein TELCIR_04639 [Teladorsagia circumcincta]|uniref:SCP domain-containing protein n=1 Tax=Teladorsagia circumcincta TaxID=45464 RepID=A0A2G9UT28_TELCI|nr:hypothetical protein TELCIR_04639 [Teladorsagia circumcincta]